MASPLRFSAWLEPHKPEAWASFSVHAALLTRVYPLWYVRDGQGVRRRPEAGDRHRQDVACLAHKNNVELWPCLSLPLDGAGTRGPAVRGSAGRRDAAFGQILDLLKADQAQGLCLDLGGPTADTAEHVGTWVEELGAAFRRAGLKLGMALRPRAASGAGTELLGAPPWETLACACDRLHILGFTPGPGALASPSLAGPLAPPFWSAAVLEQVLSGVAPGKLEWTLPGLGYEWVAGGPGVELPYRRWEELMRLHPPERRDPATAELALRHDGREAWTVDASSLAAKLWEIRRHGIGEVALWGLGGEDPRLWALVDSLPMDFLGKVQP